MPDRDIFTPQARSSDGGYYTSITDLLLGILFIFLIILTFFAAELRVSSEAVATANATRTKLLGEIQQGLRARGVDAQIDTADGVVRLTSEEMFPVGSDELTPEGQTLVSALGYVLGERLPCYTWRRDEVTPDSCQHPSHFVATVIVEGHTDQDPAKGTRWFADNWDLSAARASATFRLLSEGTPRLLDLVDAPLGARTGKSLFSIAGFADARPIDTSATPAGKARNRRIDVRFVMAPPASVRLTPLPDRAVAADTARAPVAFGRRLRFGAGINTEAYLGAGWSDPESWGVWTVGPSSEVRLPLDAGYSGHLLLSIKGVGYVTPASPRRTIEVYVNGASAGTIEVAHPVDAIAHRVRLPVADNAPGDVVSVAFRVLDPVSPSSLGESVDPRQIGFGLVSLSLATAP